MIFVICPSEDVFERTCKVDWKVDPKDRNFFVMTNSLRFLGRSKGRMWRDDEDEIRIIAPGLVDGRVFEYAVACLVPMGLPAAQLDFLRPHLP